MKPTLLLSLLVASMAALATASSMPQASSVVDAVALSLEEQDFDRRMAEMDFGKAPGPENETPIFEGHKLPYHARSVALDMEAALQTGWEAAPKEHIAQDADKPFDDVSNYEASARLIRSSTDKRAECIELLAAAIRRSPRNFERAFSPLLVSRAWASCLKAAVGRAVQYGAYKNIEVMLTLRPALAKEILPHAYEYGRVAIMRLVLQRYRKPLYTLYEAIRNAYISNRGSTFKTLIDGCSQDQLMAVLGHAQKADRAHLFGAILRHLSAKRIKLYFDSIWTVGSEVNIFVALLDAEYAEKYTRNEDPDRLPWDAHPRLVYGLRSPGVCKDLLKDFYLALTKDPAPRPALVEIAPQQLPKGRRGIIVQRPPKQQLKRAAPPSKPVPVFEDESDALPPLGGASSASMAPKLAPISNSGSGHPSRNAFDMFLDVVVPKENAPPAGGEKQQGGFNGRIVAKRMHGDAGNDHGRIKMAKFAVMNV